VVAGAHVAGAYLVGACLIGNWAPISPATAATTELVATNHHNGLAIGGFDPVAYFVDGAAQPGKTAFEHVFAGAVWRFCNEGNQAAFAADPEVYMPRFGGYDPMGVARGVAVAGDPRLWLITDERLYLFYSREARDAFADDLQGVRAQADGRWPVVQRTLSP
jgi:YHS domain-containing protein